MTEFDPIDIEFLINQPAVKKAANEVKKSIKGIVDEAEKGNKKLNGNLGETADAVEGLSKSTDAMVKSNQKVDNSFKKSITSLISWSAALDIGLELIKAYGPVVLDYIKKFFGLKKATEEQVLAQQTLNKALDSRAYKKGIENVIALKKAFELARDGVLDKSIAINKYNKLIGDTAGKANSLEAAEKGLIDNQEAYLEMMFKKAAANIALEEAAQKALDAEKRRVQFESEDFSPTDILKLSGLGGGGILGNVFGTDVDFDKAEERAGKAADILEKEGESLQEIYERLIGEAEKAAKKLNTTIFNNDDGDDKIKKTGLSEREKLLQKIADLDKEFNLKQLDSNAAEVQALKNKFSKITELVEKFNADPKNAKVKIELEGLKEIEEAATEDLLFRQDTRRIKTEIEERRKIFEEFEAYKKDFGVAKAKERYAAELKEFESFNAFIKNLREENEPTFTAFVAGNATASQTERAKVINEPAEKQKKEQEQLYKELLAELRSFEERRNLLIEQYQESRNLLLSKGNTTAAKELKTIFDKELAALDESFAKGTDEYKALIRGVENLSDTAAQTVIDNARKMVQALLASGQLSEDAATEITKKIDKLQETIDSRSGERFAKIANQIAQISGALRELGGSLESYDQGLADTVTTMGELGDVAASAFTSIAAFASGDIVGGIAGAISAIAGIFSIGARARESARQAQAELLRLQEQAEDGERRLNEIIRQRNIAKAQEVELTLKNIEAQREALKLAKQQLQADERRLFQELQNEQFINGSRTEKFGGFLGIGRKTRVVNEYADLLGLTFEEIEALFEQGKLTERAEELFEQLRRLREEGEDINGLLSDLEDQANQTFTGATANAISDSIIEGLRNGYDSFEDFAGDIEKILQNAILNSIKFQLLEEPLQRLFEQFADFAESDGELTEAEANAVRDAYNQQVQDAIDRYNQLSDVLDLDAIEGGNQSGLQGAIRRELTEETASELTGLFRGQFDITKRHMQLHEQHFLLEQQNRESTLQMIQISSRIEENTRLTVEGLTTAVIELQAIRNNTRQTSSARDQGRTG